MGFLEIFLIALGLSFDTFAVSVSTGITVNHIRFWQAVRIAIVLAVFQAIMPYLGWLGGLQIEKYFGYIDHWIAFGLLFILGMKMIIDSFGVAEKRQFNPLNRKRVLLSIALATSMDALVVGVSFALIDAGIYISPLQ